MDNINLIELVDSDNWNLLYETDKKMIVYFTAKWCGPCKKILPLFMELSSQFKDILFLKIDVDEFGEICEEMDISCMPTFLFIKSKKEVYRLEGGDEDNFKKYTSIFNEFSDVVDSNNSL